MSGNDVSRIDRIDRIDRNGMYISDKLKQTLEASASMKECLQGILAFEAKAEAEYRQLRARVGTHRDTRFDEDMNAALQLVTPWACERMLPEYKYAISTEAAARYSFTGPSAEDPTTCLVHGAKTYASTCRRGRADARFLSHSSFHAGTSFLHASLLE